MTIGDQAARGATGQDAQTVEVTARAKVNLGLEVLRRRPDGYHDVCTVLHEIELHDTVAAEHSDDLSLQVEQDDGSDREPSLSAEGNLALVAAQLLRQESGGHRGARLRLRKRIPIAAGLGGGSSDAAATLVALNALWALNLSERRLSELAARLGADVPFFLGRGAALARGRGTTIEPLPPLSRTWLLLAIPKVVIPDKTRWAYSRLAPHHFSSGAFTLDVAQQMRSGRLSLDGWHLRNVFEPVVAGGIGAVERCRNVMWSVGIRGVNLAGAGPSLFALLSDEGEAKGLEAGLRSALGDEATILLTRTAAVDDRQLGQQ